PQRAPADAGDDPGPAGRGPRDRVGAQGGPDGRQAARDPRGRVPDLRRGRLPRRLRARRGEPRADAGRRHTPGPVPDAPAVRALVPGRSAGRAPQVDGAPADSRWNAPTWIVAGERMRRYRTRAMAYRTATTTRRSANPVMRARYSSAPPTI